MQNQWQRRLVRLSLLVIIGLTYGSTEIGAQSFLSDFTWGAYGSSRETSRLGREDLVARENYCPTGGCVLKLEGVEVRPPRGRKGDTLTLVTAYSILTPEKVAIPVAITREIFFQGKALGQTKNIDSRRYNGSWTQEVDFTLPADAVPGVYTLRTKVSTGFDSKQKDVTFQVY